MHDAIEQTIGPQVIAHINGLSRCQHRIFDQVRRSRRGVITIEELHFVSLRQPDFAEFHEGISWIFRKKGLVVTAVSLSARLHRSGVESLSRLQRVSKLTAAIGAQLTTLVEARRRGEISSDAHFAHAPVAFGLEARHRSQNPVATWPAPHPSDVQR